MPAKRANHVQTGRVLVFLGLTFALSWGFDWLLVRTAGAKLFRGLAMSPWGMLVPAFAAMVLRMFFFRQSPIHVQRNRDATRWIFYSFLMVTIVYGGVQLAAAWHGKHTALFQGLGALVFTLWTLVLLCVRAYCNVSSLKQKGLAIDNKAVCFRFIAAAVLLLLLQAGANLALGLATWAPRAQRVYGLPATGGLYVPALLFLFVPVTVIGIPLSGLAGLFGEEYGWRGFLLSALQPVGKLRAAALIGCIWGLWHLPVILRGMHTYPPTLLGFIAACMFFLLWGVIQCYAVLKTGSILLAAFLHGVVNSVHGFLTTYVIAVPNKLLSFGLGIYGIACLAVVVLFILRDPLWTEREDVQ